MDPLSLFAVLIYQPFFNVLLMVYWALGQLSATGVADMGVAVIILSLLIRLLLLPMSLKSFEGEAERRRIAEELLQLEHEYADQPEEFKRQRKKVFRRDRGVLLSEFLSLVVQILTALMLWRMFGSGLVGKDLNLLYGFMPNIPYPYNLEFLGKIDLSRPSLVLNLIQSLSIFVLESVSLYVSPGRVDRKDVVRYQLALPLVSFLIFIGLPAGKKLFVITTLWFSVVLTLIMAIVRRFQAYKTMKAVTAAQAAEDEALNQTESERLVVEVK